jgi:hypothetical protein
LQIIGAPIFLYCFFPSKKEINNIKRWLGLVTITGFFSRRNEDISASWPMGDEVRVIEAWSAVGYRRCSSTCNNKRKLTNDQKMLKTFCWNTEETCKNIIILKLHYVLYWSIICSHIMPWYNYKQIEPFTITAVLHSSGTFVSGNNTLSRKMTLLNN